MLARSLALLLLVSTPALLSAQRRGRGGSDALPPSTLDAPRAAPTLVDAKTLRRYDPLDMLVDKKKKLKLTDEQVAGIEHMRDSLAAENAPALARMDSARVQFKASSTSSSTELQHRAELAQQRQAYSESMKAVRGQYASAATTALALLTDEQRAEATKMLDDQRADADKAMRPRGAAGGAGGRGAGGRPPL